MKLQLLLIAVCVFAASAGIPRRLLKKYAMRKVMESCYGEQLLSELKAEVAAARDKCRGRQAPSMPLLRRRLQTMLARSAPTPGLAQYAQNVHYVAVPVQFKPVLGQRRWRRDTSQGVGELAKAKIAKLRTKISSIAGNVSCVMREINMLTADNEVDHASIQARIASWPLPKELADDMSRGVEECRQFSACLPESIFDRRPLTGGFGKQIAFFKCMRMAKLEACMRHDLREKYLPALLRGGIDTDEGEEEGGLPTSITSSLLDEEDTDIL